MKYYLILFSIKILAKLFELNIILMMMSSQTYPSTDYRRHSDDVINYVTH